jgi:hypothetical protein
VLALVLLLDIELVQLYVKTILHGVFWDKEMYMEQPEKLVQNHNRRFVYKLGNHCTV